MESWQWILLGFFFLLPMVLMLDYWGDERVTFRGRPVLRDWHRDPDAVASRADSHGGSADESATHGSGTPEHAR